MSAGSSPRVRGTETPANARHRWLRFIPACAGNSWNTALKPVFTAVHPRVCGEQFVRSSQRTTRSGSSPRVRGTAKGFSTFWAVATVHPRVCGEQDTGVQRHRPLVGSSPRVRGTAHPHTSFDRGCRFIPACAGNSCARNACSASAAVHPRVCGEQTLMARLEST